MKYTILSIIMLLAVGVSAQVDTTRELPKRNAPFADKHLQADSSIRLPRDTFKLKSTWNGIAFKSNAPYYWNGSKWAAFGSSFDSTTIYGTMWKRTGDSGTTAGTDFIGTTDAVDFVVKTNNSESMRVQSGGNVGIGTSSPVYRLDVGGTSNITEQTIAINGKPVLFKPYQATPGGSHWSSLFVGSGGRQETTGYYNVSLGDAAFDSITTSQFSIAIGANAGRGQRGGIRNVLIGTNAGIYGRYKSDVVAIGTDALYYNKGGYIVAIGTSALANGDSVETTNSIGAESFINLKSGNQNNLIGYKGCLNCRDAHFADMVGYRTFYSGDSISAVAAIGNSTFYNTTKGSFLVGAGFYSGYGITSGRGSTFIGAYSGYGALQKVNPVNQTLIGAYTYGTRDYQSVFGSIDSSYTVDIYAKDTARIWVNKTTAAITALSSGNVGIGTQAPADLFSVANTFTVNSGGDFSAVGGLITGVNDGGVGYFDVGDGGAHRLFISGADVGYSKNTSPTGVHYLHFKEQLTGSKIVNMPDSAGTLALKDYTVSALRRSGLNVQANINGNWVTQFTDSVGGGGGSVSSASGTGVSLVNGSSAIKRLKAGAGITITDNSDSVSISANDFDWDITEQFIPTLVTPYSYYNGGSGSGSALTLDPSNSGLYNAGYGWLKLVTGTTSAGYAGFRTSNSDATRFRSTNSGTVTIQFDNVGLSALSDGTDTYTVYIGSMPYSSTSEPNNGVYFKYTHTVNSGNWTAVTANGGSRTSTNTSTAVAANTPYDLRIAITTGVATFYINGVQVASQSTNFPDNVAMQPFHGMIVKSAGSSDREMWIDATRLKYD